MFRRIVLLYWLILFVSFNVIGAACQASRVISTVEHHEAIYYTSEQGVWKIELPDEQVLLLTDGVTNSPLHLSPDQKWLSYTIYDFESGQELRSIWVISTQGGTPLQVSQKAPILESNWLENGWLLYTEYPDFYVDLDTGRAEFGDGITYTFNPDTKTHSYAPLLQHQLTDPSQCRAFLAPSGYDMVESCMDATDTGFLRVVKIDGRNPITLTTPYRGGAVAWSIDGEKVAFTDEVAYGRQQMFVWSRRSRSIRQITGEVSRGVYDFIAPSWSPDGQWIAFHSGGDDLCVVEVENGDVTCFEGYVSSFGVMPAWSPDSHAIVLSSNRVGQILMGEAGLVWDMFTVSIPDGNVVRVTNDAKMESWPVWGR